MPDLRFLTPEPGTLARLVEGRCHAPHDILGRRDDGEEAHMRVWLPGAVSAAIADGPDLKRSAIAGIFEWNGPRGRVPRPCRIVWRDAEGRERSGYDPYAFPAELGQQDLYLFNEGTHLRLYDVLGAQWRTHEGIDGVRFAVWAPNAERVSVVGDFNDWDGRRHPCSSLGASGVWSLFLPEVEAGACYKYEIRVSGTGEIKLQADPYAHAFECRPGTAARVAPRRRHIWADGAWMESRARTDAVRAPVSIYEVHLGSWQRAPDGSFLDYVSLAERLADRALELGFTHIELMPVTEHPFDGSWGYQTLGYFAPTSRFGPPDAFRAFVDHLHRRGVGVILDWVPAHFPRDAHGLARFDGSALYEHEDPRLGEHRDWKTLIFNYGRNEVRGFLVSSALYWLDEFHIDGLRVDAVASMLYLDYSREPGEWLPNRLGGRENLDAIELLRRLNVAVHRDFPGAVTIAEESTAWPQVTGPVDEGGLGFTFKWNMGWMNDTLHYLRCDPIHRRFHHDRLTFGMLYAFSERFVLPLSHDEVVHGKSSLLGKMPGDDWQKFANLRLLFAYQWTLPGKKLLFMGGEFGQWREWDHDGTLDWLLLEHAPHETLERLVRDLNRLYRTESALGNDLDWRGFEWLDCEDALRSVLCYARRDGDAEVVVALNFTPVPRPGYRIGVGDAGRWDEVLNTDSVFYGGSNLGNQGGVAAQHVGAMGRPFSLEVTLPPLAAVVLRRARSAPRHP